MESTDWTSGFAPWSTTAHGPSAEPAQNLYSVHVRRAPPCTEEGALSATLMRTFIPNERILEDCEIPEIYLPISRDVRRFAARRNIPVRSH